MNYLDGFSGYGGFHLAYEQAGWKFDKCYYSEIDKHAIANYSYNFPNSIYAGSIDTICESGIITELDLFTFGWPCQDNSIAGKRKGQSAGTRSGLLYEAVKIINKYKPRNFHAENVAGLLSVNKGIDIVESFRLLAYLNENCPQYDIEMQLLNTRWFLPQNRERLFFIGHLRGSGSRQIFPIGENIERAYERATDPAVVRCFTAGGNSGGLHSGMTLIQKDYTKGNSQGMRIYDTDGISQTLSSGGGGLGAKTGLYEIKSATKAGFELAQSGDSVNLAFPDSKIRRGRVGKGEAQTLDTSCNQGVIQINPSLESGGKQPYQQNRIYNKEGISPALNSQISDQYKTNDHAGIRRLTPTECERLQGLPDGWTKQGIYKKQVWINKKEKTFQIVEGVKELSDTQRYRLCGNGVSVPVIKAQAQKLLTLHP